MTFTVDDWSNCLDGGGETREETGVSSCTFVFDTFEGEETTLGLYCETVEPFASSSFR